MKKVNTNQLSAEPWVSPQGKFANHHKNVSKALGYQPTSNDLSKRHPFDVEISSIPPGKSNYPYHSHSAQWEFYHIISGSGTVRHQEGSTVIEAGDAFIFGPGEAHQLSNYGEGNLVYYIIADNPVGESCHYPDSNKWLVRSPERRLIRSESLDYFDDEE
ncbi:MAG: cupin domain-containing protein [Verrucomicrobia bacterium]|jgi:uncharacterized cupin superfamily protein|nr:cupin domain-containing protein [Verrucomicrobiota bacterium]